MAHVSSFHTSFNTRPPESTSLKMTFKKLVMYDFDFRCMLSVNIIAIKLEKTSSLCNVLHTAMGVDVIMMLCIGCVGSFCIVFGKSSTFAGANITVTAILGVIV